MKDIPGNVTRQRVIGIRARGVLNAPKRVVPEAGGGTVDQVYVYGSCAIEEGQIAAGTTCQKVIAIATFQTVIPSVAIQGVISCTAANGVITVSAPGTVVSAACVDDIVVQACRNQIAKFRSGDGCAQVSCDIVANAIAVGLNVMNDLPAIRRIVFGNEVERIWY